MKAVATIGHSNRPIENFRRLLQSRGVSRLIDVRRYPSSTYNPQFNRAALAASLQEAGIVYEHMPALGGRREPSEKVSRNDGWSEPAFRHYADFALTPEYQAALGQLVARAEGEMCALMCAERNWRHCHRQIIADYLMCRGFAVAHLIDEDRVEAGRMAPMAEPQSNGTILYPSRQGDLGLR